MAPMRRLEAQTNACVFGQFLSRGEPISTTGLVRSCYPAEHILGGLKSGIGATWLGQPAAWRSRSVVERLRPADRVAAGAKAAFQALSSVVRFCPMLSPSLAACSDLACLH
jgi:hypothetical protein